jgi:glycosyltransferase involved in cell wall biosynthesis
MHAWQLVHRLVERGHAVEVLTTCCRSPEDDWASNAYRSGFGIEDGVPVRRFRVDRRDRANFARVDHILLTTPRTSLRAGVSPVSDADAGIFSNEGIKSSAMLAYLTSTRGEYSAFLFMQYLYGPTLQGLPLVADRALLQPMLHNEAYAYVPQVAQVFHKAKSLIFISGGEFELAQRLYGPGIIPKSIVAGAGVEGAWTDSDMYGIRDMNVRESRYILYLGRQDTTKNVDLLVEGFQTYRSRRPLSDLKLVLAGQQGHSIFNTGNGVVNVGPVSDSQKNALLRYCRALAQPSTNESYSRTMVEAWTYGKPVIVHAGCMATAGPVLNSGGGWVAGDVAEWARSLEYVDQANQDQIDEAGARGRAYASEYGDWNAVIGRYERALGLVPQRVRGLSPSFMTQVVGPEDDYAGEYGRALSRALTQRGVPTSLTADGAAPAHGTRIIHLSAGSPFPACEPYDDDVIVLHPQAFKAGRDREAGFDIRSANRIAASTPDAHDAASNEGHNVRAIAPICVDPREWDIAPDPMLSAALQDGRTNLVYAGEFVDFAHLGQLIEAFLHFLTMERYSRLVLVGTERIDPEVHKKLLDEVDSLQLNDHVVVTTGLPLAQRLAVFQTSQLFWSMDEHENLGSGLLTAMWFDIPILAYNSPIASFLAKDCSLLITSKDNLLDIAAVAKVLSTNKRLRDAIVASQRRRRERFSPEASIEAILGRAIFDLQ